MKQAKSTSALLVLIGLYKLIKAVLLIALGVGAFKLMHREDIHETIASWVHTIHVDPENHHIHALLAKLPNVDDRTLRALGVGTFIYAALLFLIEGTGLVLRKRWAEFVAVVSTSLLLPLEIYEVVMHISAGRVVMLVVNTAVVAYLIHCVYKDPPKSAPEKLLESQSTPTPPLGLAAPTPGKPGE